MMYFFFFNDTATTEIYTLSLHDALPISQSISSASRWAITRSSAGALPSRRLAATATCRSSKTQRFIARCRSEEHTSELQSRQYLVCRLLLEKKKIYF